MGSSAGGHLASMCATLWNEAIPSEPDDPISKISCRPDFAILIYPVISLMDPWTHEGSKRRLLGPTPAPDLAQQLSTHRHVNPETPPCFLVHAADDPGVPVRNSLDFAAACAEQRVPVVLHVFSKGGHGFGMQNRGDSAAWPGLLETWLKKR
jgi:acetyl esterase/lipase